MMVAVGLSGWGPLALGAFMVHSDLSLPLLEGA